MGKKFLSGYGDRRKGRSAHSYTYYTGKCNKLRKPAFASVEDNPGKPNSGWLPQGEKKTTQQNIEPAA